MRRRALSWILAAAMTVTSLPVNSLQAFGAEQEEAQMDMILEDTGTDEAADSAADAAPEFSDAMTAEGLIEEEAGIPAEEDALPAMTDAGSDAGAETEAETEEEAASGIEDIEETEDETAPEEADEVIPEPDPEDALSLEAAALDGGKAEDDAEKIALALENPLTVGESFNVDYDSSQYYHYYSFTPETTGSYRIWSELSDPSEGIDTYVTLYKAVEDGENVSVSEVADDDDAAGSRQF